MTLKGDVDAFKVYCEDRTDMTNRRLAVGWGKMGGQGLGGIRWAAGDELVKRKGGFRDEF